MFLSIDVSAIMDGPLSQPRLCEPVSTPRERPVPAPLAPLDAHGTASFEFGDERLVGVGHDRLTVDGDESFDCGGTEHFDGG